MRLYTSRKGNRNTQPGTFTTGHRIPDTGDLDTAVYGPLCTSLWRSELQVEDKQHGTDKL